MLWFDVMVWCHTLTASNVVVTLGMRATVLDQVPQKFDFLGHWILSWGAVIPPGGHKSIILLNFTEVLASPHLVAYPTAHISALQEVQSYSN